MNRFVLGLLAVAALGGMAAAEEKADADLKKIEGTWVITAAEKQGRTDPAPEGVGTFTFAKDKKLVRKIKGQPDMEGTFRMDAGKTPKEIDLIALRDGKELAMRGIYQLDGDALKLAFSPELAKGERPTEFDSNKAYILILKRQKP